VKTSGRIGAVAGLFPCLFVACFLAAATDLGASPFPPKPWENLPEPPLWPEVAERIGGENSSPILLWGVPMEKAELRQVLLHLQNMPRPIPRQWSNPNPIPAIGITLEKMGDLDAAITILGRAKPDDLFSHATRLRLCLLAGREEDAREAARVTVRAMVSAMDAFTLDRPVPVLRLAALPFGAGEDQSARAVWIRFLREAADSPMARLLVDREELDLLFHERGAKALRDLVVEERLNRTARLFATFSLDGLPAFEDALAQEKYQHLGLEELQALQAAGIYRSHVLQVRLLARLREGNPSPEARRRLLKQVGITTNFGALLTVLAENDPQGLEEDGAALIQTVRYLSMGNFAPNPPEGWPIAVSPFVQDRNRPNLRLAGVIIKDPTGADPDHIPGLEEIISMLMKRVAQGNVDWKFTQPPPAKIAPENLHPLEVAVAQLALRLPAEDLRGVLVDSPAFAGLPAPWRLRLLAHAGLPRLLLEEMERVDWSDPAMDDILPPAALGLPVGFNIPGLYRADFARYRALLPARIAGSPRKEIRDILQAFSVAERACRRPYGELGRADELLPEVLALILPRYPAPAEIWENVLRDWIRKPSYEPPPPTRPHALGWLPVEFALSPFIPVDIQRLDAKGCDFVEELEQVMTWERERLAPVRWFPRHRHALMRSNTVTLHLFGKSGPGFVKWRDELAARLPPGHEARATLDLCRAQERFWPHSFEAGGGSDFSPSAFDLPLRAMLQAGEGTASPWEEFATLVVTDNNGPPPAALAGRLLEQPLAYRLLAANALSSQNIVSKPDWPKLAEQLERSFPQAPPRRVEFSHVKPPVSHVKQLEEKRVQMVLAAMADLRELESKMGKEVAARQLMEMVIAELPEPDDLRFRRVNKAIEGKAIATVRQLGLAREIAALLGESGHRVAIIRHLPHFATAAVVEADPTPAAWEALAPDLALAEVQLDVSMANDLLKPLPDEKDRAAIREAYLKLAIVP
jgi:hypothetical protein